MVPARGQGDGRWNQAQTSDMIFTQPVIHESCRQQSLAAHACRQFSGSSFDHRDLGHSVLATWHRISTAAADIY
ncbi:MAG: hypothetical protein EOR48_00445 [Mesorhizobium sp.]|nr:MAG: hypothetical protein EOR48_00445 [Mesorhizobium sp.]TIP47402.1 MAG: hypothetical protein E5X62_06405 [Mesorhizobium sp.]